ncbi:MAG: NAD-dependent epimerase/dehydratase family protein [Candidatus Marinimicrobia bacterium]|nr:NAD-dependent epimerase/dehydratase family protein [Candidatus Neomarinimicrobiota bacterium]
MTKVLITGAAGFVGFHLSQRLLKEGYQICGIDNLNEYYDPSLKQSRLSNLGLSTRFTELKIRSEK